MSIEILLIPLAISAVTAWQNSRAGSDEKGRMLCQVHTRMRDPELLAQALADTGASVHRDAAVLTAGWQGVEARFARDHDGVWSAHLTGDVDEARAVGIVSAVDAAYGKRVQAAVLARVRERAPAAGMRVEAETVTDDGAVTLVLMEAR